MSNAGKKIIILHAPRSIGILFFQYFVVSVSITGLILAIVPFIVHASHQATVFVLQISAPMLVISLVLFFISQQFRTRLSFNPENGSLTKGKSGDKIATFDLTNARQLISKRVSTNPGFKYTLYIEDSQEQHQILFDEDALFGGTHWVKLASKLSKIAGIPLKSECWAEDMNGNISLMTREKIARRKRNLIYGLVPIALSFAGALVFRMDPTPKVYLYAGLATVSANIAIASIYAFLNKEQMGDLGANNILLVIRILTLVIPFAFFYMSLAFLLNGFRLPVGQ